MKYIYYFIMASLFLLASCNKDESEYEPIYSPIGNTYETGIISITFESADSVSFRSLLPGKEWIKGKAAYTYNGGLVNIVNPFGYGVRPNPEVLTIAYFLDFWCILKADRIEHVSFFFIGPHECQQSSGGNAIFYLIKDK